MALRAAARLATRAVARAAVRPAMPARVVGVRALSGDHNPYTHSLDLLNTEKKASEIDLGDGKKQVVYERVKVEPSPEHTPPIRLSGLEGKIASNVYSFASAHGQLDQVEKDFETIYEDLLESEEWANAAGFTIEEKLDLVNQFLQQVQVSEFTKELLPYFVQEKMDKNLKEVIQLFFKLMREKRGEIDVIVTSAEPLEASTLSSIETLIKQQIGGSSAAKVNFETSVDKDLIAGLRIQYKSTLIDNTVARKLSATKDTWVKAYQEAFAL